MRFTLVGVGCVVLCLTLAGIGCGPRSAEVDEPRGEALPRPTASPPLDQVSATVEITYLGSSDDDPKERCAVSPDPLVLWLPPLGPPGAHRKVEWVLVGHEIEEAAAEIRQVDGVNVFNRDPANPPHHVTIPQQARRSPPQTPLRRGMWVYEVEVTEGGVILCTTDPEVCVRGQDGECPLEPRDDEEDPEPPHPDPDPPGA
jgi:hypothetical protein